MRCMRHQAEEQASPDAHGTAAPRLRRPSDTDGDRKRQSMGEAGCRPPYVRWKRQALRTWSPRLDRSCGRPPQGKRPASLISAL